MTLTVISDQIVSREHVEGASKLLVYPFAFRFWNGILEHHGKGTFAFLRH
jgi:hypothetical protein